MEQIVGWRGARGLRLGKIVCAETGPMASLLRGLERDARSDLPVLVTGESGVGKELIAGAVHALSRRSGPIIPLNCAALPTELAESELFGHVRGAFTGARERSDGAFVAARRGTIFLDEIGELPLGLQSKLLRVLESGEVRPVGSPQTLRCDVRVVAATNRELLSPTGTFRADLYYRLAVLTLHAPPLRERLMDLPLLVPELLSRARWQGGVEADAMRLLLTHQWPGNVRELRNVLLRALQRAQGDTLAAADIAHGLGVRRPNGGRARTQRAALARPRVGVLRAQLFQSASETLSMVRGDVQAASRALGIPRSTLYRWLKAGKVERAGPLPAAVALQRLAGPALLDTALACPEGGAWRVEDT